MSSFQSGTSTGGAFSIASGASLGSGQLIHRILRRPDHNLQRDRQPDRSWVRTWSCPANYNFAGSTNVYSGVLQVDGSLIGSGINVSGGTLSGTGTVGAMSVGDADGESGRRR